MKFKQLAAVGLVTAMVFSTAGCSSKSQRTESSAAQAEKMPENSQEKAQGGEPVEIVYLNSHADVWEGDVGKEIIQKFEESHPGIKVKTESYPFDQMIEMVEVKMKSKLSDFDVLNVDAPLVTSYSVMGYLEPFENYMSRDELDKVFTQTGLNAAAYDGKVMTAPKRESGMIMVYNKDILDENNIPYPAYETDKRMTWEECLDICRQVTKVENGTTTCWGIIGDQINRVWNVMPLANSLGAAWLSEDGLTATGYLNSEASVKAMTFYQDLFNKYGVSPKGVNTNEAREMFETGKVAFTWGDPVCYARAKGKGINVGVCPVPYFEGGVPAVGCDSWHIGINANSKHKEEAAEFIKYITVGEGSGIFLDSQNNIGANMERIARITDASAPDHEVYALLASDLENYSVSRPKTPGYNEWSDVVNAAIEDIRNGADVKTTLDTSAARIDDILKKYTK